VLFSSHGGIIPPVAKHLHEQHISRILKEAMHEAKVTVHDLDAIAVTVKPGKLMQSCELIYCKSERRF
jgi:tRNA A37 threonylcarbamoyltransferase TsaD